MLFSMMNLFFRGRLLFMIDLDHPNQSDYFPTSDHRLIEYAHRNFVEYGRRDEGQEIETTSMSFAQSHQLMMHQAILTLYIRGTVNPADMEKAREYYEYMRQNYRDLDGNIHERYGQTLEEFMEYLFTTFTDTQRNTIALLTELMNAAFLSLAQGDYDGYTAYMNNARAAYDRFMSGKEMYKEDRGKLQKFPRVVGQMLFSFLVVQPVPTYYKGRVWSHFLSGTPEETDFIRMIFDQSRGYLSDECEAQGFDLNRLFPEPAEMAAYREAHTDDEPFDDPYLPTPSGPARAEPVAPPEIVKPKGLEK
jgi:hypothetical protein